VRRAWSPAPGQESSARREVYATIILQGKHARMPDVIDWLVRAYAELQGVSGYWIIAVNCTQSGVQVAGYACLALRLQTATGRPAVVSCVGDAHLALLASGVAATCAGLHGMSFTYPPAELSDRGEDEDNGVGVHVYHRAVMGNVGQLGEAGESARRALFLDRPCGCGHHPATQPPMGKQQTVAHNSWATAADAAEFSEPVVVAAEALLARRAQDAKKLRSFLKMTRLKAGFAAVPRAATALRDRDADVADEQR